MKKKRNNGNVSIEREQCQTCLCIAGQEERRVKMNDRFWSGLSKTSRMMKLVCLFFLAALMQVAASTYSQNTKLSLTGRNLTIEQVLGRIEDQSSFSFFYNINEVDLSKVVNVNMEDESIETVLNYLFDGTGLTYTINNKLIIIHPASRRAMDQFNAVQQRRAVKGKVTDADGAPLPGVTVVVKGTTGGTVTDTDGGYSLTNIPSDATLVYSFVGMKTQEINVEGRITIDVVMREETIGLQEVVAIGYGTMRKSDLTFCDPCECGIVQGATQPLHYAIASGIRAGIERRTGNQGRGRTQFLNPGENDHLR